MQVKRALDLTDLTLSYNHRFGQGDYGETFKFEASLTFLISRITDSVCAHCSVATPVGANLDTPLKHGDSRLHGISRELFLRGALDTPASLGTTIRAWPCHREEGYAPQWRHDISASPLAITTHTKISTRIRVSCMLRFK